VSHDLGAISRLCDRAIWLENGRISAQGPPQEIVARYLRLGQGQGLVAERPGDPVDRAWLEDRHGRLLTRGRRGEPLVIAIRIILRDRLPGVDAAVWITDREGTMVVHEAHSDSADEVLGGEPGTYELRVKVPALLRAGPHLIGVWVGRGGEELFVREVI